MDRVHRGQSPSQSADQPHTEIGLGLGLWLEIGIRVCVWVRVGVSVGVWVRVSNRVRIRARTWAAMQWLLFNITVTGTLILTLTLNPDPNLNPISVQKGPQ